jgi:hypothetical protein
MVKTCGLLAHVLLITSVLLVVGVWVMAHFL